MLTELDKVYILLVIVYFMVFTLPVLGYEFNVLEPYIDSKTMEIHYDKHHKAYVDKLNSALEGHSDLLEKEVDDLISDLDAVPGDVRGAVRNHGGGHSNHTFFWKILGSGVEFGGKIKDAIEGRFGNFESFREKFKEVALGRFGSGWAWLVVNSSGELEVMSTANQDSPLSEGKKPVLGLDLWEHAYYLKYMNRRADYVDAFWSVVNWDMVNEVYGKS